MDNQKQLNFVIVKKTILISLYYLFMTLTYASFSNIIIYMHEKYEHHGYGQLYLTTNSISALLTYFYCPTILKLTKITPKTVLLLGSIGYAFNFAIPTLLGQNQQDENGQIPPPSTLRVSLQVFANMIGGVASTFIWVVQGGYLNMLFIELKEKGRYFSIFNAIINLRSVLGPMITVLALGYGNVQIYFGILTFFSLFSGLFALIFLKDFSPPPHEQQQIQGFRQKFCKYFTFYKTMIGSIPLIVMTGLIMGFVSTSLSHLLPKSQNSEQNDRNIGISLIFFGVGTCMGGYIGGYVYDRIGIVKTGKIGIIMFQIVCIQIIFFLWFQKRLVNVWVVGISLGILISYFLCYFLIVCTEVYQGELQSYAITKQLIILFYVCYQWLVTKLNNPSNMKSNMTIQLVILMSIGIPTYFILQRGCGLGRKHEDFVESETEMKSEDAEK